MGQLPGKKLRQERYVIDGALVLVDLRVTSEGEFFSEADGEQVREKTLQALRAKVQELLEQTRRMTWRPYIDVSCVDGSSSFHHGVEYAWGRAPLVLGALRDRPG